MTPPQLDLARRRLWLGITNVGFWVLLSAVGLYCMVTGETSGMGIGLPGAMFVTVIAIQAVFDFVGGINLMPGPRPSVTNFMRGWVRGVFGHTIVLVAVATVSATSLRHTGGFGAGIVLAMAALAFGREQLLRSVGGGVITEIAHDGETIVIAAVNDPSFTGGIIGLGRRAKNLLPASWMSTLPEPELTAESARRRWQIANGLPTRAFVLILCWNLLGTFIGTLVFQLAERPPTVALTGHACWMTLWTFASLLVLPALSRKAVLAADRAAADSGHAVRAWIERFPGLVGEDGSSTSSVQTIFYPTPSATLRRRQLDKPLSGLVLGNLARSNLYYSWATLTLLGRAVHCNVGRPALWVFPPSA
jgi:hypothetical protein